MFMAPLAFVSCVQQLQRDMEQEEEEAPVHGLSLAMSPEVFLLRTSYTLQQWMPQLTDSITTQLPPLEQK